MTGCDPTVSVFQPSSQSQYSLHGWLDVAADTQAIRVEPLQDPSQLGSPHSIDANLLLRDLNRDTTVTLRDSFATVNPDSHRDPVQVHTFWTTYPLQVEASYRLLARLNGRTVSSADMTTPQDPTLIHNHQFSGCKKQPPVFKIYIRGARRIAAAHVTYPVKYLFTRDGVDSTSTPTFDVLNHVEKRGDEFVLEVYYGKHGVCSRDQFVHPSNAHARVTVAVGGSDWPAWRDTPRNEIARTDTLSNVQGGHGFVGSAYTDTIRVPFDPAPRF